MVLPKSGCFGILVCRLKWDKYFLSCLINVMLQANEQITRRLALLVVTAILLNSVCILSVSASGDDNACAVISTAYAEWIANEGECLLARKKEIPRV